MPNMASTELSVTVSLDDSATMDDTIDAAQNLLDTLSKYDDFETVGVMTGSTTSLMGLTGTDSNRSQSLNLNIVLLQALYLLPMQTKALLWHMQYSKTTK